MKIEVVKEKLQSAVSRAGRLATKHSSLPILSHILLTAKRGTLTVRATNLDMGVEYTIPVRVEREGAAAVPAVVFASFVSNLAGARNVMVELKEGKIFVAAASASAYIHSSSADEFPTIPKAEHISFTLNPKTLLTGLRAVQYAGALGNLKPELSSVYLYQDGEVLVFAATDSFRLAEERVPLKKTAAPFSPALIPLKNATEFVRILEEEQDEIRVFVGKGQFSIEGTGLLATSRLTEGSFPNYQQIIPSTFVAEAVALKEDVVNALKLTALFSDRFNQLHLSLDPTKKALEVSAKNGGLGESAALVPAALSGETVQNNFNHRYITDCLPAVTGDSVSFRFSGENKPLLVSGVGNTSFRYLVMPMNR